MKPFIYPYKIGSHSARDLARALGTIQVRENGNYRPKNHHVIINWGNPRRPTWGRGGWHCILNGWQALGIAQDKLRTFEAFKKAGISHPEWTTDKKEAEKWYKEGNIVVCRTLLGASSGRGIVLGDPSTKTPIVSASLFTMYKKKKKEFRVHVFNTTVIDVQQKRRANGAKDAEEYNAYIRSHDNGWIFAREDIVEPKELRSIALAAIEALGLDFGAVDIIWNEKENKCYCLEVNTAPGLEGQTLQSYKDTILKCLS